MESRCRVCNSTTDTYLKVRGWPLQKCSKCKMIQVSKEPTTEELNEIYSSSYFNSSKYTNTGALEKELDRRINILEKCDLPKNAKVLEIGCADGLFLDRIDQKFDVYANDYSVEMIDKLKEDSPDRKDKFQAGSIESLDYPNEFFDAIVLWDVIEHIWDVQALAERVTQWLKKDGHLLISSPDINSFTFSMMKSKWAFMTPPEHLTFFSKSSLKELFASHNFELESYMNRGKWVNFGFLLYKVGRVFPTFGKLSLHSKLPRWASSRMLYVPTNDIFYSVLRKRG